MFKEFLCFLSSLIVLSVPNSADQDKYLAVFCTTASDKETTETCIHDWDRFDPDKLVLAKEWSQLEPFLDLVAKEAGNKPIILDIECHGNDSSGLLSTDIDGSDIASLGWLLKKIDSKLHGKDLTMVLEACYPSQCMERSLKVLRHLEYKNIHLDSFDDPITFPIYSNLGNVNYNNLVYLQYHFNVRLYFQDLRDKAGQLPEPADHSKKTDMELRALHVILSL